METPNDINSRIGELEHENRILKHKNSVFIECILILKKGLNLVAVFDEELEEKYEDTGYLAQDFLSEYKEKIKKLNINA